LYRRLSQLAHNLHTLDKLAARLADRMRREQDADTLGLAASHVAITTNAATAVCDDAKLQACSLCPPSRTARARWIATTSSREGAGCASSRGWLNATGPPSLCQFRKQFRPRLADPSARSRAFVSSSPNGARPPAGSPCRGAATCRSAAR